MRPRAATRAPRRCALLARRGLLIGEASDPDGPEAPGLVVLDEDWNVESLTPGAEGWLAELPDGDWRGQQKLPPSVLAVAGRALRTAEGESAPGEVAIARVLSTEGRWILLHGASLVSGGARRVAVIVEAAHPARITPLLMTAYGLTEREQDVARLVLHGESTAQIADRLSVPRLRSDIECPVERGPPHQRPVCEAPRSD